jgi:hypothetical protein
VKNVIKHMFAMFLSLILAILSLILVISYPKAALIVLTGLAVGGWIFMFYFIIYSLIT